jgi:hypothetical protein
MIDTLAVKEFGIREGFQDCNESSVGKITIEE